jgi:hypothetical protein
MSRMAATRVSDGRVQFWVLSPTILTSVQTAANPTATWTPLVPFNPVLPGNRQGTSISAGNSPDGRVQLWVTDGDGDLWTTWMKNLDDPNSGFYPWEQFPSPGLPGGYAPAVGQLKDGRMQLFGVSANYSLMTTWKVSTEPNAPWSGWSELNPNPSSPHVGVAHQDNVGFDIAVVSLSNGLLQLWTRPGTRAGGGVTVGQGLQTVWQTTNDPTKPWSQWQNPFNPQLVASPGQGGSSDVVCLAGANAFDDCPQLFGSAESDVYVQCTWKTSVTNPSSAWSNNWSTDGNPAGGSVVDVAVASLKNANPPVWSIQVWVLSYLSGFPTANILTQTAETSEGGLPTPSVYLGAWSNIGTVQI